MLLLAVLFVTLGLPSASTAEAANGSLIRRGKDSEITFQVTVTEQTRVVGGRTSFAKIAVDGMVRIQGSMTADGRLVATGIEVLLAGHRITPARRARIESDGSVTQAIW